MIYVSPSGRRFVLVYHSLEEWAASMRSTLVYLGCSEEYAEKVYRDYVEAVKP